MRLMQSEVIFIKDGRLYHEIYRGEESQLAFQQRITDSLALVNGGSVNIWKLRLLWHHSATSIYYAATCNHSIHFSGKCTIS